jgi:octaheme c-type cytochrome (tetrathionate reductase family)
MSSQKQHWITGSALMVLLIGIPLWIFLPGSQDRNVGMHWKGYNQQRVHLDHSPFFDKAFSRPQDVTRACLECHPKAAKELMKTQHWKWEGELVKVPGHDKPMRIGKKNLLNNFCIGIRGNWRSCTICHAGYGWADETFDFTKEENVDCLICHDWSGTYVKGDYGMPEKGVDLLTVARKVGYPRRDNCGICHAYGGGGMGVKHGDLDNTLVNPAEDIDIHMGRHDMRCVDCHKTRKHKISGKAYSVSVNHEDGIGCRDCHEPEPHRDRRINAHLDAIACQTCHIPTFAKKAPTKTDWDWSKAGDKNRPDDPHHYLRIKGEFIYDKNMVPEYDWFNMKSNRYILGDKIKPGTVTYLNKPMGDITDPKAKIWPFKIHRAKQPYDTVYNYLLQPVTAGEGGFWSEYDWDKAMRLGEQVTGLKYSGSYGFAETYMAWPLSHMVSPAAKALQCCDCHSDNSRMDWKKLGYGEDPKKIGGRKENQLLKAEDEQE